MRQQIANPSVAALYEDALVYETGSAITSTGALTAYSGAKTGRSPLDKRIVKEEGSEKDVWWGPVNKPMMPDVRTTALLCLRKAKQRRCFCRGACAYLLSHSHAPLITCLLIPANFWWR